MKDLDALLDPFAHLPADKRKAAQTITKLLAHAAGTSNEHEAASFEAKAVAMMAEHSLAAADLQTAGIVRRTVEVTGPDGQPLRNAVAWIVDLYSLIGARLGVYVLFGSGRRFSFALYGTAADVARAEYLCAYLDGEMRRQARAFQVEHRPGRTAMDNYRTGLVRGVAARMDAIVRQAAPDKEPSPFAVVLSDAKGRRDAAKDAAQKRVGTPRPASLGGALDDEALRAGYADGQKISVSKGVAAHAQDAGRLLA